LASAAGNRGVGAGAAVKGGACAAGLGEEGGTLDVGVVAGDCDREFAR